MRNLPVDYCQASAEGVLGLPSLMHNDVALFMDKIDVGVWSGETLKFKKKKLFPRFRVFANPPIAC